MPRPFQIVLLSLAVVAAACTGETAETTTTASTTTTTSTTTSTTTTTIPTTTTLPPPSIDGATPELVEVIDAFYDFAATRSEEPPPAAEPILAAMTRQSIETPSTGVASMGAFKEQAIATVEAGGDLFLLVADGAGWRIVGGVWPTLGMPAYFGGAPRIVAVVGSDARPGENPPETRADSIHFVGLDGNGAGAVVGVPRDSWVTGPGGKGKITNVLANHGPDGLMQTFVNLTGLPLEGYVLTGFTGFEAMIGEILGGVTVTVPFAINDRWAKASLAAGEQVLDGAQALAFARARKTVPGGDFTRSSHQGRILIGAAKTVKGMGYGAIPGMLEASEPWITTDLTPEQLLTFSAMAISADLDSVPNFVAPGSVGRAGRASVVFLSSSASALWADLADGRLEE
ncbi:MAG: LCP family protein [Actinobacteria bacterium]|nr:LCP family protein [Actinomycetota bacterium]